jgi:hypothetical protein
MSEEQEERLHWMTQPVHSSHKTLSISSVQADPAQGGKFIDKDNMENRNVFWRLHLFLPSSANVQRHTAINLMK